MTTRKFMKSFVVRGGGVKGKENVKIVDKGKRE
jgi:hypothetical protein